MPAEQGMERLIIEYGDAVLRMCFLYLKDYHLAEDAAQETFIKAMKHYDSFNRKSSEKTWLTRIAINCCKNIMRMNWFRLGRGQLEENIQTVATDPIEKVCGSIFSIIVCRRLDAINHCITLKLPWFFLLALTGILFVIYFVFSMYSQMELKKASILSAIKSE